MQVSGVCVEPVSSDIILCINCWQKQALSWLEASWINNIQLSSSFCWLPTNWLLTVSELIWLMLPNIFLMMTEKKCSNVDKFTRTETFCGSDCQFDSWTIFFSNNFFTGDGSFKDDCIFHKKVHESPEDWTFHLKGNQRWNILYYSLNRGKDICKSKAQLEGKYA